VSTRRTGVTLIELLVVLVLLGLMAGLTTVSFRTRDTSHGPDLAGRVAVARRAAIESGQAVELVVGDSGAVHMVRALPDGRVLADTALGIDPMSGRVRDASR